MRHVYLLYGHNCEIKFHFSVPQTENKLQYSNNSQLLIAVYDCNRVRMTTRVL